jgi:hypothetical protein
MAPILRGLAGELVAVAMMLPVCGLLYLGSTSKAKAEGGA